MFRNYRASDLRYISCILIRIFRICLLFFRSLRFKVKDTIFAFYFATKCTSRQKDEHKSAISDMKHWLCLRIMEGVEWDGGQSVLFSCCSSRSSIFSRRASRIDFLYGLDINSVTFFDGTLVFLVSTSFSTFSFQNFSTPLAIHSALDRDESSKKLLLTFKAQLRTDSDQSGTKRERDWHAKKDVIDTIKLYNQV